MKLNVGDTVTANLMARSGKSYTGLQWTVTRENKTTYTVEHKTGKFGEPGFFFLSAYLSKTTGKLTQ